MHLQKNLLTQFMFVAVGLIMMLALSTWAVTHMSRLQTANAELPMVGDSIDSQLDVELVRPFHVAAEMANNTFLLAWLKTGEKDVLAVTRYLAAIEKVHNFSSVFVVSQASGNYYSYLGIVKEISNQDPIDQWFFRVAGMDTPYEITVDHDSAQPHQLTIFVNYRIVDEQGAFIGATGVGLSVSGLANMVKRYAANFQQRVVLMAATGQIIAESEHDAVNSVGVVEGRAMAIKMLSADGNPKRGRTYFVRYPSSSHVTTYVNARYIPQLDWYLLVERDEQSWTQAGNRYFLIGAVFVTILLVLNAIFIGFTIKRRSVYLSQKANVLAAMSHDLKHLLLAVEMLLAPSSKPGCGSCQSRIAVELRSVASEIQALGERFLSFYRLDAGIGKPQISAVRLVDILNQLKTEAAPLLMNSGRSIDLKMSRKDRWILTDKVLCKSILRNFVANAIKFAGSGNLILLVDDAETNGKIKIRIIDFGPGLASAFQGNAFDLFSRGNDAAGSAGHGMGLFLVASYARKLGCEIGYDETYKDGACFWISIPRAGPQEISSVQEKERARAQLLVLLERPLTGKVIGVVALPEVCDYLRKWGADVHDIESGKNLATDVSKLDLLLVASSPPRSLVQIGNADVATAETRFLIAMVYPQEGGADACPVCFHCWPMSPPRFKSALLRACESSRKVRQGDAS